MIGVIADTRNKIFLFSCPHANCNKISKTERPKMTPSTEKRKPEAINIRVVILIVLLNPRSKNGFECLFLYIAQRLRMRMLMINTLGKK